jgi:hypothetical protein
LRASSIPAKTIPAPAIYPLLKLSPKRKKLMTLASTGVAID